MNYNLQIEAQLTHEVVGGENYESYEALRPTSVIKDDNVATLLLTVRMPTFITINVDDFWRKITPHVGYPITSALLPLLHPLSTTHFTF